MLVVLLLVACGASSTASGADPSMGPEEPIAIIDAGTISCSSPPLVFEGATDVEVYAGGVFAFATAYGVPTLVAGACVVEGR